MKVVGLLVVLPILIEFTEAAIASWQMNSDTAVPGINAALAVSVAETSATTALFTVTATVSGTGITLSSYAITSQPNTGQFEIGDVGGTAAGEVKLASGQTLDFEAGATITIEITATDSGTDTGVGTVTLTVTDVTTYEPAFTSPSGGTGSVCVVDQSAANTAIYTLNAGTSATLSFTLISGNTNTDLSLAGSTGAITVANTLDRSTTASYTLIVEARDSATTTGAETSTATLTVNVESDCSSGASATVFSTVSLLAGLLAVFWKFV